MKQLRKMAICLALGLVAVGALAVAHPPAAPGSAPVDRLSRQSAHGRIAMRASGKHLPGDAKISFARTHSEKARGKVVDGLAKKWRGRHGGKKAAKAPTPRVLAMYDVSINAGSRKWQPAAGEPVKVTVELAEPVAVTAGSSLEVAHLADDGTVEELDASRYGFTYSADKSAVTAFWFSATGFSVYAIVDGNGDLVTPRRFYHFYDHPMNIDGVPDVKALPYLYHDESNNVVNVQIVKSGDELKEPPIPPDILDGDGNLVSMFEGWYIVSTNARAANAVETKLDATNEYFQFVWPVGVTDMRLAFTNAVTVTETEDTDYFVVPLYEHARFLQFNENTWEEEQEGGQRIIDRKLVAINDETGWVRVKVSDVSAALVNGRQEYFCGWRYKDANGQWADLFVYDDHGQPQDQYITIDDVLFTANGGTVIPLYPIYVTAHFLNFDTNAKGSGATYVGSIFVRSISDFSSVTPSGNRPGYDFAGWCAGTVVNSMVVLGERVSDASGNFIANVTVTNATGTVIFYTDANGNIRLNKDVTLYASWVANSSASYRVIIWQQRVTDAKDAVETNKTYYYVTHYTSPTVSATTTITDPLFKSFTGTRADGTSISPATNLSTLSGKAETNAANEDFTGFHYARYSCTDETVAPDGSTVINVYYDRDLITLRFCLYDSNQTETTYSRTTSTSGDIYGTDDGENYFAVYYDNGQWYRTRTVTSVQNGGYYYSDQYSGTRYTRSGYYNYTYTETTGTSGTQYGKEGNSYFRIYRNDSNGLWYKTRGNSPVYSYSDLYNGYRYTVSTSHWIVNQAMTGLYGQTLAGNGYTWPSERAWKDSYSGSSSDGTSISFLDAFLPTPVGDESFYSSANSSSSGAVINFYKEALDGSWTLANEYHSGSSSVSFNISDKYNGFEAYQYSKNGGAWTSVGTYNEDTGYYGSQVASVTSTLDIRFKRKAFELIYKDGDATVYDTGKTVPYESSLAGYDLAVTNSLLNWGSRDTSEGTFAGWYEDASLTVPFDFTATMPDGKKLLYAKWNPVKYKVIVDPNGGEMQSGDSTWFYLDAGEKLLEYTVTRNYRLDMHSGTFYYHHDLWDPVKDKHTDQYDPSTAGAPRRAYYTLDIAEATSNEVTNPENRYAYEPKAYAFMGWYEVLDNGTLATDPFNFVDPPNRPVTIRALWRRTGVYTLHYESVDPDGLLPDEVICDPEQGVEGGYIDDAVTTMAKDPTNYNKDDWVWEGWQVVDTYNNNIPLTGIRSPGDVYVVHEAHADRSNVIHFRAVYKYVGDGSSKHIPPVTDLVLDANDHAGLAANAVLPQHEGRSGIYDDGASAPIGGLNEGVWFAGQQNNFSVNLTDYSAMFAHTNGYFLLGWDPLRDCGTMIPKFYANETIGIDKNTDMENILYAVWEPQIYIEFVNDTGAALNGVQIYIPGWVEGEIFRVNSVQDTYHRAVFSEFQNGQATFNMAAGEHVCLVLPDGAEKDFAAMGTCSYSEGTKLVVKRIQPQVEGQESIPNVTQSVYPGESFMIAGTMKVSPTPVQVRFTNDTYQTTTTVPVRYFLHDKNGTVTEITQYDATYWRSQNYQTSLTVGAATNDIAGMLRTDNSSLGVHELLSDNVRTNYGHTTIGIGVASAVITTDHETLHANEYRSITQEGASGGPYFKFYHEELDWSRYSQIWNGYDDPAVYVVFYKRTPVHVTVGKNVVGSEEDKSRTFDFTAEISQHSTNLEYTVTTTYRQTRTLTCQTNNRNEPSASAWNNPDWSDPVAVSTNASAATASSDQTPDLFESRVPEHFSLADSERHPITIYYDSTEENIGDPVKSPDNIVNGARTYVRSGNKYTHSKPQTNTWTQTVTYRVTYQYEVATIQEAAYDGFTLTSIDGGGDSCKGTGNLSARTYTISSLSAPDAKGFFTYQSLDTAIFTNTRKTGSLTVSKTVVDGHAGDTFPFTVTLGETVVDKNNYTNHFPLPAGVHIGPYGKVFSFTLADGGSVTLPGLPAGVSYVVEEVAHNNYIATVPANATGTVVADATTAVGFTNTHKTDLVIAMQDATVIFTGEEQRGHDISSVTGTGSMVSNDAYVVTGLKSGHVLTVEHYLVAHGTAVGNYVGHFENARFTVHDASDEDVTGEYIVTTTPGALTIVPTPIIVTVTGNQETKTYNGAEQECSGYTYEITHATTHEVISNVNVYVAIPPDYQTAKQKDVGRRDMYLGPSHVIVTVPDGMSVSNIVVAANGYLEITPASVTVKADDKEKFMGDIDPVLTVTVTGLFGSDTVVYGTPSRVAGEEAGEYAITTTGASEQGNYVVTFVPGKLTITRLALFQRATDSDLPLMVEVTRSMLEASGYDMSGEISAAAVSNFLNQVDANTLRRWENLVTGTDPNQVPLGTGSADGTHLAVRIEPPAGDKLDLGYTVLYDLRRNVDHGWARVDGPKASELDLSLRLLDDSGKSVGAAGFYRVFTLLVPNHDLSITNELPATNIIGVLEVDSTSTNTMTAVPWTALAHDPSVATNIVVSDYMKPAQLAVGDTLHTITDDGVYQKYTIDASGNWTNAAATITRSGAVVTPPADERELTRGNSVWVTRNDTSKPYFLVGQYSGENIQVPVAGSDGTTAMPTMRMAHTDMRKSRMMPFWEKGLSEGWK